MALSILCNYVFITILFEEVNRYELLIMFFIEIGISLFSFFVVAQLFPSVDGEKLFPFPKIVGFAQQTFLFPLPSGKIIPQILNLVSFPLFYIWYYLCFFASCDWSENSGFGYYSNRFLFFKHWNCTDILCSYIHIGRGRLMCLFFWGNDFRCGIDYTVVKWPAQFNWSDGTRDRLEWVSFTGFGWFANFCFL